MSLISAIYKTKEPLKRYSDVNQRTDEDINQHNEVDFWQGRWDLHRWLENIYENKGGKCGEYADNRNACNFNGVSLEIDEHILDDWEQICTDHKHFPRYFDDEYRYLYEDIETIMKCRNSLDEGYLIFYWPTY